MSVVCAKVYKEKIVMAADSIKVCGWSKNTSSDFIKMEKINDMIVGGVGWAEETSLFYHYMRTHSPLSATEKDVLDFVIEFYRWKKDLTGDFDAKNTYLFAYDGKVFRIDNMFVYEIQDYCSIGAGMNYANAALYLGHSPQEAVKATCELCCMVAEPILVEEMKIL